VSSSHFGIFPKVFRLFLGGALHHTLPQKLTKQSNPADTRFPMELLFLELVNQIPLGRWEERATNVYDDLLKGSMAGLQKLIPLLKKECVQPLSVLYVTFVLNLHGVSVDTEDGKRTFVKKSEPVHRSTVVQEFLLSTQFRSTLNLWWMENQSICDEYFDPSKRHFHPFWESMCVGLGEATNAQLLHVVYYRLGVVSSLVARAVVPSGRRDGLKWKADDLGSRSKFFNLCGETFLRVLLERMGTGCIDQIAGIRPRLEPSMRPEDSTVEVHPIDQGGVVRGYLVLLQDCFSDQFVSSHADELFPLLSFCQDPNEKKPRLIRFETMSHKNEKKYTTYGDKQSEKLFMAADRISQLGEQQLTMANTIKGWYRQHCLDVAASYLDSRQSNFLPQDTAMFDSVIHTYSEMSGLGEHSDAKPGNYDPSNPDHDSETFMSATIGFSPPTQEYWRYLEFYHGGSICGPAEMPLGARYMHVMLPGLNGVGMTHKVRVKPVQQYKTTPQLFRCHVAGVRVSLPFQEIGRKLFTLRNNFPPQYGGPVAYSRRKRWPTSDPGLSTALIVSDFDEVITQTGAATIDMSVDVSDDSLLNETAADPFQDTSTYKYKPMEVRSAKLEEVAGSISPQPLVDIGSIDSIVVRPENLLRLFGKEKCNVALHSGGREKTVNLLGPLVDQVSGTPLQPGDLFGKDQVTKLLGLRHETVTGVCQPWHPVNTPSAAVCNQSYKNELPFSLDLLKLVKSRHRDIPGYKYELTAHDITTHSLRGPRVDLFLLSIGKAPLGWKLFGCSGNSIRNDQQASTGCRKTNNARLTAVMDQDPCGAMNSNMNRHCAAQSLLSVFFNDIIAGGDGGKLVYLYPYTTSGTCVSVTDTHEHLDEVVEFQKLLFGESVTRDFLNFRTGLYLRWQLGTELVMHLREGGWRTINVAFHDERHLLLPYPDGLKTGDPSHSVLRHHSMSRESVNSLFFETVMEQHCFQIPRRKPVSGDKRKKKHTDLTQHSGDADMTVVAPTTTTRKIMSDIGVFATTRTELVMSLTPSDTHVECLPGTDLSIRGCLRVKERRKCSFGTYLHLCLSSAIVGAAKRQGANLDQHGRVGPLALQSKSGRRNVGKFAEQFLSSGFDCFGVLPHHLIRYPSHCHMRELETKTIFLYEATHQVVKPTLEVWEQTNSKLACDVIFKAVVLETIGRTDVLDQLTQFLNLGNPVLPSPVCRLPDLDESALLDRFILATGVFSLVQTHYQADAGLLKKGALRYFFKVVARSIPRYWESCRERHSANTLNRAIAISDLGKLLLLAGCLDNPKKKHQKFEMYASQVIADVESVLGGLVFGSLDECMLGTGSLEGLQLLVNGCWDDGLSGQFPKGARFNPHSRKDFMVVAAWVLEKIRECDADQLQVLGFALGQDGGLVKKIDGLVVDALVVEHSLCDVLYKSFEYLRGGTRGLSNKPKLSSPNCWPARTLVSSQLLEPAMREKVYTMDHSTVTAFLKIQKKGMWPSMDDCGTLSYGNRSTLLLFMTYCLVPGLQFGEMGNDRLARDSARCHWTEQLRGCRVYTLDKTQYHGSNHSGRFDTHLRCNVTAIKEYRHLANLDQIVADYCWCQAGYYRNSVKMEVFCGTTLLVYDTMLKEGGSVYLPMDPPFLLGVYMNFEKKLENIYNVYLLDELGCDEIWLHAGTKEAERRKQNYGKTDGQLNAIGTNNKLLKEEHDSLLGSDARKTNLFLSFWGRHERFEDKRPRAIETIRMMRLQKIIPTVSYPRRLRRPTQKKV
jgi:hypothetical protein